MSLNFPNAPTDGEQSLQSNGVTYQWDATYERWDVVSTNGGDYAQGSYLVEFFDAGSGGNKSPSTTTGYWTRVGNLVTVNMVHLEVIDVTGMTGGAGFYTSMPFESDGAKGHAVGGAVIDGFAFAAGRTYVNSYLARGNQRSLMRLCGDNIADTNISVADVAGGNIEAYSISYFITDADKGVGNPAGLGVQKVVQVVHEQDGAHNSGATTMPNDDTIPQITEGNEFLTATIVPKDAGNDLLVEATIYVSSTSASDAQMVALFRDAVADALAAGGSFEASANQMIPLHIRHKVAAGSVASTTFRIRGGAGIGTMNFNGANGLRKWGGVATSAMTITELTP